MALEACPWLLRPALLVLAVFGTSINAVPVSRKQVATKQAADVREAVVARLGIFLLLSRPACSPPPSSPPTPPLYSSGIAACRLPPVRPPFPSAKMKIFEVVSRVVLRDLPAAVARGDRSPAGRATATRGYESSCVAARKRAAGFVKESVFTAVFTLDHECLHRGYIPPHTYPTQPFQNEMKRPFFFCLPRHRLRGSSYRCNERFRKHIFYQ